MKSILDKSIRGEKGQALILVLILLLVGSLILTPLLSFMSTGLMAVRAQEERMYELYAADAGVEYALWHLISGNVTVSEGTPETLNPSPMNDKTVDTVEVTIENQGNAVYKITSVATSDDGTTTVVSYVSSLDFSGLWDNAITSPNEVTLQPGTDVQFPEAVVDDYPEEDWPPAEDIIAFYKGQVDVSDPYSDATLDLDGVSTSIGPEYIEGEFNIYNSDNTEATLTLTDTLYITGKTLLGGQKEWTLNLNGNTIFVESDLTGGGTSGTALWLGGNCTITGSGVIVAVGDIYFSPYTSTGEDDFIFVMSIDGRVLFQPRADFHGSIAGNVEVQLMPGGTFYWRELSKEDEDALNWPSGNMEMLEIITWEVSLQ